MTVGTSVLETLAEHLRSSGNDFHAGAEEAPVAVLWTDPDGAWRPVAGQLRELMPELLELGDYAPEERSGPAIWLKCVLAGRVPEVAIPSERVPVLYLPGVARHQLRSPDRCPWEIQPLVELMYRGVSWAHPNGRDWTLAGFLQSAEGLGLEVAGDERTKESLRAAIGILAKTPLEQLRNRGRLEAADFDAIVVGDTPRDLLTWIGSPEKARRDWGEERWYAFRARCRDEYGFDPEKRDALYAAEQLGRAKTGPWRQLWTRYSEAPGLFCGVRDALSRAQPADVLPFEGERWPEENANLEKLLREALEALEHEAPQTARERLMELEAAHGPRRRWVWASLAESPLAMSLDALHRLAQATRVLPSFDRPEEWVEWYVELGWRADEAALMARGALRRGEDERPVCAAIRSVYAPWLDEVTRRYQAAVAAHGYSSAGGEAAAEGECLLFVDGLRYDAGRMLAAQLEEAGFEVACSVRLAALPTVTPSAKPAVSPIAEEFRGGGEVPPDFRPCGQDGSGLSSDALTSRLKAAGYQHLKRDVPLEPASPAARGWMETGHIDRQGHALGADLATVMEGELKGVAATVRNLFSAGWKAVKVITDHGWLLLPGGLAKHDLPGSLVESRWARCAAVKGASKPDAMMVPWRWNALAHVAVARGAMVFRKGEEYAHGGVSLQECVTPVLRIRGGGPDGGVVVRITGVRWKRMRCVVDLSSGEPGLQGCIILDDGRSSVSPIREVEADGHMSLLVQDEDLAGKTAAVVITDAAGRVVARTETRIGG